MMDSQDSGAQAESRLERFAAELLATATLDELVSHAPIVLGAFLGPGRSYALDLFVATPGANDQLASARERMCVPLRRGHRLLGTLLIEDVAHLPALDEGLVSLAADLLATTIESRLRLAEEQHAQIAEAAHLKLDVISVLSHEMRTPLASIKGYATALLLEETDWDEATRQEFLAIIADESDRLTRLIEDILESAAIDTGSLRLELEPVLLPRMARRVVERIAIQSDTHQFVVMFPPEFPAIEADAGRIEQVLTNLIDNAVKYSPGGGLTVVRGEVRPDEVLVSVVDQGIGINPEDLNKLFDRFFRASTGRRQVSGTGLGLPISSAIIRAHGGRIWAESKVGRGTTLTFTIPHPRPQR